jgi:glucosamine-phosphate N-acetyltransferase
MAEQGLFSSELISPSVAAALPDGYTIRALRPSDFSAGFLDCLRVLTTVGDITEAQFAQQFEEMKKKSDVYYILVIEDASSGKPVIVGTGALVVEAKL